MMELMEISVEDRDGLRIVHFAGRLDAHGVHSIEQGLHGFERAMVLAFELSRVDYLSSAGIRLFVAFQKMMQSKSRRFVLVGLQPYCLEVLRISGLEGVIETVEDLSLVVGGSSLSSSDHQTDCGRFQFSEGDSNPCYVEVAGRVEDVLNAGISSQKLFSRRFSKKEFSIGLGGLGPDPERTLPLMGEMVTIGGTMVWLPTDGEDTPDYLVPYNDEADVFLQSGFNISIGGHFNELVEFESASDSGASIAELYASLFKLARQRRPDYRGALGLSMRAEIAAVYGSGIKKSPIPEHAPANGKPITDTSNFFDWFEYDDAPRLKDVTGLLCGVGIETEVARSSFSGQYLDATFYMNPANQDSIPNQMLHNHGVFFSPQPLGERPFDLDREIRRVVEHGDFLDMRHLLDRTAVIWALIGVSYIQEFRPDRGC